MIWRRRSGKLVLVAGIAAAMSGCQYVGPVAIDAGRDRYNSVLHSTAKVQTLSNIVRTYKNEPTEVMDVTEVDATQTLTGTAAGTVAGIGAKPGTFGTLGTLNPSVGYSEAPLIHYVPLVGQGLVSQLVTPVGVDALESLINSGWPADVVLDLAANNVTPDIRLGGLALNIIAVLTSDEYQIATLAAGKSDLTAQQSSTANQSRGASQGSVDGGGGNNNASKPPPDDTLTIFLQPLNSTTPPLVKAARSRLWPLLLGIYQLTLANSECLPSEQSSKSSSDRNTSDGNTTTNLTQSKKLPPDGTTSDANRTNQAVPQKCRPSGKSIELRTAAVTPQQKTQNAANSELQGTPEDKMSRAYLQTRAPVLRTLSALGILRNATGRQIQFVSPSRYSEIINEPWNIKDSAALDYYTMPATPDIVGRLLDPQVASAEHLPQRIDTWLRQTSLVTNRTQRREMLRLYEPPGYSTLTNASFVHGNEVLFALRRYVLVIEADAAPADAYVAYPFEGKWYYIAGNDEVSKTNFNLIALFLTVMAVPSTTPQIGATVSVGG